MLQLPWAGRTRHYKGGQQCDTSGLMSTERIKPDFPTPLLSGNDKIYPSTCFRTGAGMKGLGIGGKVSPSLFISLKIPLEALA